MRQLKILIACEESQAVCKAFRRLGHEAYSCDIMECSGGRPEWHITGDAIEALSLKEWALVIAHPPCTYLTNSGVRWLYRKDQDGNNTKFLPRWESLREGVKFFKSFQDFAERTGVPTLIENPIPHKYAVNHPEYPIGKYTQVVQPWQFGHGETKATCFWLYNLPEIKPTNIVDGRKGYCHSLPPSDDRAKLRSKTYEGIAEAIATQYNEFLAVGSRLAA